MKSIVTAGDMSLKNKLFNYTSTECLPLSFGYGEEQICGIPASFAPEKETIKIDAKLMLHIFRGRDASGLEIRMECLEYLDYAAVEYVAYLTNHGATDSAIISDLRICGCIDGNGKQLIHGNGDTLRDDGYEWYRDDLSTPVVKSPTDGTSCNGAFPYMRLMFEGFGVNAAIGWPTQWIAEISKDDEGMHLSAGQRRCHTVIHPGETIRTPRVSLVAFEGDETRGMNMWRRWYFDHILPRENGKPIPPVCCMHYFQADGKPEFTGASEKNQLNALKTYLKNGVRPDAWWVDAGWYPCNYDWPQTGTWTPDPARFPNGLAPIGKKCAKEGVRFLLWFEPERVRANTELAQQHPEWLIRWTKDDGTLSENFLLNLGDPACCDWLIDHVDGLIKESGVNVYRQDFNFNPAPYWQQAEAENRIGAIENLHAQGYLRYWDALLERNPGLWIDSCASGGRRNDLETMRRAVTLHYTDVGYGNHPIKQKQHRQMFEWIPYFRAHNMNWDKPDGTYGHENHGPDRFAFHAALTPALTDMLEYNADEEAYALSIEMQKIWRKAAEMMLSCDYYPLTECRKSSEDFYAMQFHDPDTDKGFFQILSNINNPETSFTLQLHGLDAEATYRLTDAEGGGTVKCTGEMLMSGLTFELPPRSGLIFFYERKRKK